MQKMVGYNFQHMVDITADALVEQLSNHMPEGHYRDFYRWGFSAENPQRDAWLQTVGLTQLVRLTVNLYEGLVDDADIPRLVEYCIPVNIYQVYEIVSDNLGIGLANPAPDDTTHEIRREILLHFNDAMVERLTNPSTHAADLLAPVRQMADGVSIATQSLSSGKHRAFMQTYLASRPHLSQADLEYGMWSMLVANIEACADVVAFTQRYQVNGIIADGLARRYQGVSHLLRGGDIDLGRRLHYSTDAILVNPIIAYFIGGISEEVRPVDNIHQTIQDTTLPEALYLSGVLIRLLNDLGTGLVMQTDEERAQFIDILRRHANRHQNLNTLFRDVIGDFGPFLSRIDKDLRHGEFNLALFDLLDYPSLSDALDTLEERLGYYAHLYAESRAHMWQLMDSITQTLDDQRASAIIKRCLLFHEHLYAHSFEAASGEYAI